MNDTVPEKASFNPVRRLAAWCQPLILGGCCMILGVSEASATTFDQVYAFGNSLSDVGNVYAIAPSLGLPEQPTAPYANGQFSNGPVWVQDLTQSLGLPALTPSLLGGTDYAYGSAETGTTLFHTGNLADLVGPGGQIAQYQAVPHAKDPNALYTIWIGSNDLFDIPPTATPSEIAADLASIVANIDTAIEELAADGAKNFLVLDAPDLGKTPDGLALGPIGSSELSLLAYQFDQALFNGIVPLGIPSLAALGALDGLNLDMLDTYSLLDGAIADPALYGLSDVTDPCLTGAVNYGGGTVCSDPGQYLFWDGEHPTAATHGLIAAAAENLVVPEPAPVSVMTVGLAGICVVLYRRKLSKRA